MATKAKTNTRKTASATSASSRSGKTAAPKKTAATKKTATAKKRAPAKRAAAPLAAHSRTTTDHDEIRQWAEQRGAHPACVKGTGGKRDSGLLRLDFPGYAEDSLQEISWDEFFKKFDENNLALVYQEKTADGELSNFNKLVNRESAEEKEKPKTRAAGSKNEHR